jgi:multisubunit Na+/H+ antiporter MnhG subunit
MLMTGESPVYLLTREIANGTWFMLSVFLALGFLLYILANIRRHRKWSPYQAAAVSAAGGLMVWFVGSGMRAGIMWLQWLHAEPGTLPLAWPSATQVYIMSTLLGVIGAAWVTAVFASWRIWFLLVLASLGVPVAMHAIRAQLNYEAVETPLSAPTDLDMGSISSGERGHPASSVG